MIPFLDIDRRYFLDPSLLRFSNTPLLQKWDDEIKEFLRLIHRILKSGDREKLQKLLSIGEAKDAGLGYCSSGVDGSGFGKEISENIIKILAKNPEFLKRGFIRLEELQWLDMNVGPDRISDLAINILKRDLIEYTQSQVKLLGIPMEEVRIEKVFYPDSLEWGGLKAELPVNPLRRSKDALNEHPPQLLIPKEAVKMLPLFLNYDDFYGFIDRDVMGKRNNEERPKESVIETVIANPKLSADYIKQRETESEKLFRPDFDSEAPSLLEELDTITPGNTRQASRYRDIVGRLLHIIFDDLELIDTEKRSAMKDKSRDLILENNAESGIFLDFRNEHRAKLIAVDAKNSETVTADDVSRIADYLNDNFGRVAVIVSRTPQEPRMTKHAVDQLINQKKVILFVSDTDLKRWARGEKQIKHIKGEEVAKLNPVKSIERKYKELLSST